MGRHANWTKNLAGFQLPFLTNLQEISYPQEVNRAAHGYGAAENQTQETDFKVNTADAMQSIACSAMEDKKGMANLTSINLTLSQSLMQAQEKILVLYKLLQALQTQPK